MINGFISFIGCNNVYPYLEKALKEMKHRAWHGYLIEGNKNIIVSCLKDLHHKKISGKILSGYCLQKVFQGEKTFLIHGKIYHHKTQNNFSEIIQTDKDPAKIADSLREVEGEYAFVTQKDDGLVFARDPLGVKPLFIGRKEGLIGISSEAKALRAVGLEPKSVSPGFVYYIDLFNLDKFIIKRIEQSNYLNVDLNESAETVLNLLQKSIKKRLKSKKIAIAFSGGIDSSLLAILSSEISEVKLISVYAEGSKDEIDTKHSAKSLGLDFIGICITEKKIIKRINSLIEPQNPMNLAIGLAINEVALVANDIGCNELILGQLADELFGGYMKYLQAYKTKGYNEAHIMMINDTQISYKNNFERDELAASPYTELLLPYASFDLAKYALSLHPNLKINIENNDRKIVLREAALKAGLPVEIVFKPKKALQYSTNLQKLIKTVM
ncbi:asparagine synthase-related protein [Thermoproteota archaeon]